MTYGAKEPQHKTIVIYKQLSRRPPYHLVLNTGTDYQYDAPPLSTYRSI